MTDHLTRKRWIKLWTQETIHGTTMKELTPEERGIWFPLLCMAGDSPIPGKVCIADDIGYTDEQLSKILNCKIALLKSTKETLIRVKKIRVNGANIIEIVNFVKWQGTFNQSSYITEYMKDYRKGIRRRDNTDGKDDVKLYDVNIDDVNINDVKFAEQRRGEEGRIDIVTESLTETISNNTFINKGDKSPKELLKILNDLPDNSKRIAMLVDLFKHYHSDALNEELANKSNLYSRIGTILKRIDNRHGLLLKVIIQSSTESIDSSHLDYIERTAKSKNKQYDQKKKQDTIHYHSASELKDK